MTDVAVFGATPAGIAAAVAAHEAGASVILVEPGRHLGGMVSGGLSWTDVGDTRVLGGFAHRFYQAVADHYGAALWELRGPEPHVAEQLFCDLLDGVEVLLGEPELPAAAVTIDASYEGDVLAARGLPFRVGREDRALHGERWAGRQPAYRPGKHNFPVLLSPFADDGALLPHIREPELDAEGWPAERLGEGDGGLQAYGFRVCLADRDAIPFERPADFDEREFAVLERYLEVRADAEVLGLVPDLLPNGKCDVNSIGPFSLNVLDGSNRDYLEGDREAVRAHHLRYTQSLLWFLSQCRPDVARWGLCPDEFRDTGGWPHQLYVRDARRLVGAYVLREQDLLAARPQNDAIAVGSYNIDIREIERTWRYLPEYTRTPASSTRGTSRWRYRHTRSPTGRLLPAARTRAMCSCRSASLHRMLPSALCGWSRR